MPEIGGATFQSSTAIMPLTWHYLIFLFSKLFSTFKHLSKEIHEPSGRAFIPYNPKKQHPLLGCGAWQTHWSVQCN